ncbi:MAG: hypothetical protein AAF264_09700 [Pseudomonadota bacterium]
MPDPAMTRAQIDILCAAHPGATPSAPGQIDSRTIGVRSFVHFGGLGPGRRLSVKTPDSDTAAMPIDAGEAAHRIAASHDAVHATLPGPAQAAPLMTEIAP